MTNIFNQTIKVGVIGDTGMIGSEILRILRFHDKVAINYKKNSKREEGNIKNCDVVFLATNAQQSMDEVPKLLELEKKVIDLSGAYRLSKELFENWYGMKHNFHGLINKAVYGLPAINAEKIKNANLVANPGCYSTAAILALKPLGNMDLVNNLVNITATSGISGARKEIEDISNERTYSYGRKHKQVPEIELYSGFKITNFVPIVLESVYKGINANILVELSEALKWWSPDKASECIVEQIQDYYSGQDQIRVYLFDKSEFGTKDINNTHEIIIRVGVNNGYACINSLIDNLGKGAASQAVENMNIMLDLHDRLYGIRDTYKF